MTRPTHASHGRGREGAREPRSADITSSREVAKAGTSAATAPMNAEKTITASGCHHTMW